MNDDNRYNGEEKDPWSNSEGTVPQEAEPIKEEPSQEQAQDSGFEQEVPSAPEESQETVKENDTPEGSDAQQPEQNPNGQQNQYGQNQYGQNPYGQSEQYRNPQNPNAPYGQYQNHYGQYQNPYGGYQNPYGNNNNPYGSYNAYPGNNSGNGQQNPYNPNPNENQGRPYWSYQQYGGQNQYNPQNPKGPQPPRKNPGLRIFLWILGVLAVGSVLAFTVYGVYTASGQRNGRIPGTASSQSQNGGYGSSSNGTASGSNQIQGGIVGNGTNPNSTGIVINAKPAGNELTAKQVYRNVVESVVGVQTTLTGASGTDGVGEGTGIIASSDGYILTNAHVVNYSRSNQVKVILHNKKEYVATVVGFDKTSDLAVLKINANDLKPASFGDAGQLEVGDPVVAIGNPGGMIYSSTLTGGLVSALDRSIETHSDNGMTYIQTDAAINPGNSGGPLVNMYGQVVGINSNKIVAAGYEGMGFAIPISKGKSIIDELITRGYVSGRSRLGITATPITQTQQMTGYPAGVQIREIGSDSDLRKSDVVAGDVITKADGTAISSLDDLYAVLSKHKAGDTITLTIFSKKAGQSGSTHTVKTKLLEDKGETQTTK